MMPTKSERISLLSEAEQIALYELPDFNEEQRNDYFAFSKIEHQLVFSHSGLNNQVHCALQVGYFKAKQTFFRFIWQNVPEKDLQFLLTRYFQGRKFQAQAISKHEHYSQRAAITTLFGYRPWTKRFLPQFTQQAALLAQRDVTPRFIVAELITELLAQKIVRPGYTTLQTLISEVLTHERQRLNKLLTAILNVEDKTILQKLLIRDTGLSELAALKQDAKHFAFRMMTKERQKRAIIEPLYQLAITLLPTLAISQQNIHYYASLVHYHTIYDLRRLKPAQAHLYLLCYAWQRYRQLNDNLIEAMAYHIRQLELETQENADQQIFLNHHRQLKESEQIGRLLLLYVDEALANETSFGAVREQAFAIIPKEALQAAAQQMCDKPTDQLAFRWQAADKLVARSKKNLRPLFMALKFSSDQENNPWLAELAWFSSTFLTQGKLSQRSLSELPLEIIPKKSKPYLLNHNTAGEAISLQADRYELWIYRQVQKQLNQGGIYLGDSVNYRSWDHELVSVERASTLRQELTIPCWSSPLAEQLDALSAELHQLWRDFDEDLRLDKLKHLSYDVAHKNLLWHKPKASQNEETQHDLYSQLPLCDISEVFQFVNERCQFLSALTPLQPRYAKKVANQDSLLAVILAQAMNHGNLNMAEISDIPYHVLESTQQQYMRLAGLKAANDCLSNAISRLSIFPHYSFELDVLYGGVDGQKFSVDNPTTKARYSRKYFGTGKGVVAYTLLSNHVPLQCELIGAHEHESHYVYDIWNHNSTDIIPMVVTGDMHSINKVNFLLLYWFGAKFQPRFANLHAQLKHLYCMRATNEYADCLIKPIGQIDRQLILDEETNINRIIATLSLKEMSQKTLIKKLCSHHASNQTRKAIFEYDRLIRSIYTLRYLRDLKLQRNVHRSQNRIESYHQLRSAIAQVSGKKQLTGRTDLDIAISNECGRLVANTIIYYNSAILSFLLDKHQASGNQKALKLIQRISPVAWQHIHFLGHYNFSSKRAIDLNELIANLILTGKI